jgi:hypothetical protein
MEDRNRRFVGDLIKRGLRDVEAQRVEWRIEADGRINSSLYERWRATAM